MTTARFRPLACVCLLGFAAAAPAAPPAVTYLFPAGVQRGQTVEVTAAGSFERWPVQAWCDGQGIEIRAAGDKGKLSISAAADVVPGVYWLRLHDEQGASTPRPFVVGNLPEVLEREPNDDPKKPQLLESSAVVNGRLEKVGDVDTFAVRLHKGQTLVASMLANRVLGSPMDAVLQVVSADGFVLGQNHDSNGLDPQIVFTAAADGIYLVRTFAFPATPTSAIRFDGAETYVYRLTLTTGGFAEYAYPLAVPRAFPGQVELVGWNIPEAARKVAVPGEAPDRVSHPQLANAVSVRLEPHPTAVEAEPNGRERPQPITLPVTISGRIDPAGDVDVYQFEAAKGQKLFFQVEAWALGFSLDPVLRLTDGTGKVLAQADDVGSSRDGSRDAELSFMVPEDGTYRIEVRDLHSGGGLRHVYRLRATLAEPDFDLTLAADRFILTPSKPLEIPVTVVRRNGFADEVVFSVVGLPEGVTAAPAVAAADAKSVTLRLTADAGPVAGPIRIVGKAKGKDEMARTARSPLAGLGASTADLWLTVARTESKK
jgi:hypothetical protein